MRVLRNSGLSINTIKFSGLDAQFIRAVIGHAQQISRFYGIPQPSRSEIRDIFVPLGGKEFLDMRRSLPNMRRGSALSSFIAPELKDIPEMIYFPVKGQVVYCLENSGFNKRFAVSQAMHEYLHVVATSADKKLLGFYGIGRQENYYFDEAANELLNLVYWEEVHGNRDFRDICPYANRVAIVRFLFDKISLDIKDLARLKKENDLEAVIRKIDQFLGEGAFEYISYGLAHTHGLIGLRNHFDVILVIKYGYEQGCQRADLLFRHWVDKKDKSKLMADCGDFDIYLPIEEYQP